MQRCIAAGLVRLLIDHCDGECAQRLSHPQTRGLSGQDQRILVTAQHDQPKANFRPVQSLYIPPSPGCSSSPAISCLRARQEPLTAALLAMRPVFCVPRLSDSTASSDAPDSPMGSPMEVFSLEEEVHRGKTPVPFEQSAAAAAEAMHQLEQLLAPSSDAEAMVSCHPQVLVHVQRLHNASAVQYRARDLPMPDRMVTSPIGLYHIIPPPPPPAAASRTSPPFSLLSST